MCEQVENILMRLLVPDNDVIRQVVTALFSGSKYLGNVPLGRIAVYGSTKLTLPDDSTHPPDSMSSNLFSVNIHVH